MKFWGFTKDKKKGITKDRDSQNIKRESKHTTMEIYQFTKEDSKRE